mmetsp:Transcript_49275/g.140995  ORF Transcript_49275/g.140995 Transcript_49275/m.140995 type:complete len:355 (-) Transcript_49275:36-1100(-)
MEREARQGRDEVVQDLVHTPCIRRRGFGVGRILDDPLDDCQAVVGEHELRSGVDAVFPEKGGVRREVQDIAGAVELLSKILGECVKARKLRDRLAAGHLQEQREVRAARARGEDLLEVLVGRVRGHAFGWFEIQVEDFCHFGRAEAASDRGPQPEENDKNAEADDEAAEHSQGPERLLCGPQHVVGEGLGFCAAVAVVPEPRHQDGSHQEHCASDREDNHGSHGRGCRLGLHGVPAANRDRLPHILRHHLLLPIEHGAQVRRSPIRLLQHRVGIAAIVRAEVQQSLQRFVQQAVLCSLDGDAGLQRGLAVAQQSAVRPPLERLAEGYTGKEQEARRRAAAGGVRYHVDKIILGK